MVKKVMISSTARDLPQHRKEIMDACLSQGMLPTMMEYLPASSDSAVEVSLKMVEESDIYVGVFAHRYGYIPDGYEISVTEMEYNHAVAHDIPRLIFLVHENHPSLPTETGENESKLAALKDRLQKEQVVNYFKSPEDLRAHAINSLAHFRTRGELPLQEPRRFSSAIQKQISYARETIAALTKEQYQILNLLRYQKRVAIAGCAGSGKTLLAAEKAIRLDTAGFRTLVLCHSSYLSTYIKQLVMETGVQVWDFTSWIHHLNHVPTPGQAGWTHYQEPSENELSTAFDALIESSEKFDAILVDEGQDFRELWWTLVEAALESQEHGILYIFHDDNQALLPSRSKYPILPAPFVLSKNCRNTGEVFELVKRLHPQSPETAIPLQKQGIVKQMVYEQGNAIAMMQSILQQDMEILPLEQFVILTLESDLLGSSILEGVEFEIAPRWRWQDSVQYYLNSFGELALSENPYPTESDIKLVYETAKDYSTNSRDLKYIRWKVADDQLILLHPFGNRLNQIRAFFAQKNWAEGIPRPHKIRITSNPVSRGEDIPLYSVSSFKGLESDGVILFIPYPFQGTKTELEANIYVGLSRARFLLHMVLDKRMVGYLPEIMLPYHFDKHR